MKHKRTPGGWFDPPFHKIQSLKINVGTNNTDAGLKDAPCISRIESLAAAALLLVPPSLTYVVQCAAGMPLFGEVYTWFTLAGSVAIAYLLCRYRPGYAAGFGVYCVVVLAIGGAAGLIIWAVFPVNAYSVAIGLSFVTTSLMAGPIILSHYSNRPMDSTLEAQRSRCQPRVNRNDKRDTSRYSSLDYLVIVIGLGVFCLPVLLAICVYTWALFNA